jgi:hypothetical protein
MLVHAKSGIPGVNAKLTSLAPVAADVPELHVTKQVFGANRSVLHVLHFQRLHVFFV